jgi:hypothetical protein
MSEARCSDVDPVMNNVEEEVESDAGEGEEDSDRKEKKKVKLKMKKKSPKKINAEKKIRFKQAADDLRAGKFKNIGQAAQAYSISYGVLWAGMVKRGGEFQGSGQFTERLCLEEEQKVVEGEHRLRC